MINREERENAIIHQNGRGAIIRSKEAGKVTVELPDGRMIPGVQLARGELWEVGQSGQLERIGTEHYQLIGNAYSASPPASE